MNVLADMATGHTGAAEVCFLVALVLFALAAALEYMATTMSKPWPSILVAVGLTGVALGWFLL